MSVNFSLNGRTLDPNTVRQIQLPEGKTASQWVDENKDLITKNFKDELYFEVDGQLYVTEDTFVFEAANINNTGDAKVKKGEVPLVSLFFDDEPDEHKVTDFAIEGATDQQAWLEKKLKIEKDDRVSLHDLQKEAKRLFESEKFLSVNFVHEATDKGIKLTLKVTEIPKEISFVGLEGVNSDDQAKLKQLFPQPLNKDNIPKGLEAVEEYFKSNENFLMGNLDFDIKDNKLVVMVNKVDVPNQIRFHGLNAGETEKVNEFFERPLSYENIDKGMEATRKFFNDKGLILPNFQFMLNPQNLHELNIVVQSAPMPIETQVTGATAYSEDVIKGFFKEPLNMNNIQDGLAKLKEKYTNDGYVLLPPEGVSADLKNGVLTVIVAEAKLGDIEITGNNKTKDEFITRELRGREDEPLNMKTLDEDLRRVYGSGLFSNVSKTLESDEADPSKVKVRVHVNEEKSSSFTLGAGFSKGNGIFGTAGLNLGNVDGKGSSFFVNGTAGMKMWGGEVGYYNPWMFDNRTSFGATAFHRQWEGPYSSEMRSGTNVSFGGPLGDKYDSNLRWNVTTSGERIQMGDAQYTASGTGVDWRVGVRTGITYDNRDDKVLPHEGYKLSLEPEIVGIYGGGQQTYLGKIGAQAEYNQPLGERFTLTGRVQGGSILGDAPLYEKYHNAGLGRTLYGWDSDGSLIGNNYAIANVGVRAHIWGPISATAGVTGGDFFDGTDFSPKVGAGVGVNVKLGGMLLNAGYGFKLYGQEKSDDKGAFHIGFGIPF